MLGTTNRPEGTSQEIKHSSSGVEMVSNTERGEVAQTSVGLSQELSACCATCESEQGAFIDS